MAYKSLSTVGLGFEIETFDPEMGGKYVARYRKIDKRKNGTSERDGWLMWPVVNGKRYHEFYADLNFNNSPAESLVATIKRRDEVLALREDVVPYSEGLIGSNFSGRNGVSFAKERYKTGAKGQKVVHQSACWCATWTDYNESGKKHTTCKKFSIKKYGFWEAYKRAVFARWNWENTIRAEKGFEPLEAFDIQKAPWMEEMDLVKEFKKFTPDNLGFEVEA